MIGVSNAEDAVDTPELRCMDDPQGGGVKAQITSP